MMWGGDLVIFEIYYADRIGENYFVAAFVSHWWSYFFLMIRDEVLLLK